MDERAMRILTAQLVSHLRLFSVPSPLALVASFPFDTTH